MGASACRAVLLDCASVELSTGPRSFLMNALKGLCLLFVAMLIGTTLPAAAIESRYFRKEANAPAVIIFVHGLFGDANSSWTAKNGSYWPKLLAEDSIFNGVDIFLYEYPTGTSNDFSIDEIAEDMRIRLDADGVSAHRELIFLSHSMGGLVTRSYLIKNRGVAARTKFLYLLSSPTTGSELANLATLISQNPQIAKMRLMQSSEYLADLQRSWLSANFGFPTYCAYEKKGTFGILVVSQISASSLCTRPLDPIDADHVDIAKPLNQKSAQFEAFANAYRESAAITFASSNEMSVQYARLFGALEIPKLMALIPNPSVRNDFEAPEYRTFGSGPSWDVVRTKLLKFAEQLPFKDARPVLTPMWTDIAGNLDAAHGIFLRASSGNQKERACFYSEPTISGFFMAGELLGSLWPGWKACKKIQQTFDGQIGFTFLLIENDSSETMDDVVLYFRENYTKNGIVRGEFKLGKDDKAPARAYMKDVRSVPDTDPLQNLVSKYSTAKSVKSTVRALPPNEMKFAKLKPGEKLIIILNVYFANSQNLPAGYLYGIYEFDRAEFRTSRGFVQMAIRPPYLEKAARVAVPYGWFNQ